MDQKLDICNRVYEIATYNMRTVCVTINKYNVNKPFCMFNNWNIIGSKLFFLAELFI